MSYEDGTIVIERFSSVTLERSYTQAILTRVGAPGPSGAGSSTSLSRTKLAAETLSGHRMVRDVDGTHVDYVDVTNAAHVDSVLGMTVGAAAPAAPVVVAIDNEIIEPSWAWTPLAPIYVTGLGMLTQVPPSAPDKFSLEVGYAITPTSARIRVGIPLML